MASEYKAPLRGSDEGDSKETLGTKGDDRQAAIRERFQYASDSVSDLYSKAQDDFKFAWKDGEQWDSNTLSMRGDRPKYEFNRIRQIIKQVINDNRQNTPGIKVRATEDGDKDIAEIRQGLIRNIEAVSNADQAYDWGGLYAISAGFGCWEVATEYAKEYGFDQNICIKRLENPFSVYFDPDARELNRSDANYAFVVQQMRRSEFKRRWPKAQLDNFEGTTRDNSMRGWWDKDTVRVCKYWEKTKEKKRIYRLSDGSVVDADGFDKIREQAENPPMGPDGAPSREPITVEAEREIEVDKITYELVSGTETLEGPFDWAGKYIPLVPVWGDYTVIDGAPYWYGMVRMARDAQTLFNYSQSNLVEVIAKQPNAPWLYTPAMIQGFDKEWANSAVNNAAGLPYNFDPSAPGGMPKRENPPTFPTAYANLASVHDQNLKAVTGVYDASLGNRSNETSGKAIMARQHEGDVANYDYSDNIVRAVQYTGIIINDLIPHIYDAQRDLRILGDDMTEKYLKANNIVEVPVMDEATGMPKVNMLTGAPVMKQEVINDITQGNYDVTVTTGPSYTTLRMETLDAMTQLAQSGSPAAVLGALGVMEFLDVPGLEPYTKAMRRMLIMQGVPLDPEEGDPPPAQPPQPDPKTVADAEKSKAQAALYGAQAEGQTLENQAEAFARDVVMGGPPPVPMGPPPMGGPPVTPAPMPGPPQGMPMPGA